ncbi:MAG: response regulator [Eudoraea sp.]|nr:response regulator [Eudoraea sp.]
MKHRGSISCLVFVVSIILYGSWGYAQDERMNPRFSFERFSTEDGLPSATILDIVQGHEGYIWLATEDGLVRYNGYQFLNFRNIPGDSTSMSRNQPEKLFVDFKGDIWIGSKTGINRYSQNCECFIRYSSYESAPDNQQAGQINAFAEDRDNNLWIGTQEGGLFRYDRDSDSFTRFLDDPNDAINLLEDEVRVLLVDKSNLLWIGTGEAFDASISGGGLVRFDLNTGGTKRFVHDAANPNSLIDNRISALMEDREGKLWIGSCQSGLHYYVPEKEEFIRMMPDPDNPNTLYAPQGEMGLWSSCPHVKFIHQDHKGEYWVGTYNAGINHFDPVSKKLNHYEHNPSEPSSLGSNQVWSFLQDRQDRLWIGNLPGGLHKIDPSLHKFKIYTHEVEDQTSLSFDHVMGIYEAPTEPGIVWVGTRGGGLNKLDTKTGQFQHYRHQPRRKNSIGSDIVWTTYEDSNGTFWVGTEAGLYTLDRQTGEFTPFKNLEYNANTGISYPVIRIYEDRHGYLWLGTWSSGMIRLSKDRKTFKQYQFSNSSLQTFYNSVFAIHEDANGKLWAGVFHNGLFEYDAQNDAFSPHLEAYGATSIQQDSTGLFWVGTVDNGILHYNPTDGTHKQYTAKDGLPSNAVFGVLISDQGGMWLSTGNGIARFEPKSNRFMSYDSSDGLSTASFGHTSAFKGMDGQLFFGGIGGLVSFYPTSVKGNTHPPDVLLSGLQIAGQTFDFRKYQEDPSTPITLSHQLNDLTFDYVGLHFTNPSKNRYKYRMWPYDADWIEAGTQRTARYTNLDPGEYSFQVIARSSDGVWNEEGASLQFNISSPWWTKWWAYALYLLVAIILLYSFYQFQLNRKLEKAEAVRLKELDVAKNRLFTNITHEFRTPLTVISGMSEQIREHPDEWLDRGLTIINRNSNRLNTLVNQMLDLGKLESGKLKLDMVQADIIPFVKYLCESFNSTTEASQLKLTVYAETEELVMDFDSAKLTTVIINLLSNAIKFTPPGGKIIVHFKRLESEPNYCFTIKVKDNGSGISKNELKNIFDRFYQVDDSSTRFGEGTGIGLALTKELVELMGGNITVKSKLGKGSEFEVQIPITNNAKMTNDVSLPYEIPKFEVDEADSNLIAESVENSELPLALIIEDNEDVARYLKICLREKYQVLYASDGTTGLELAYEKIPDIVISDVMMPGKDGFEVCATLKKDERTDHIPVILLTAKATLQDRISGLSHGADAYLTKPFNKAELFTRLNQLMLLRKKMIKRVQKDPYTLLLKKQVEGAEAGFLNKTIKQIHEHMDNHSFGATQLAFRLGFSESQVYRKLKAISGKSTALFIRSVRLQRAKELILSTDLNISEISYEVGFNDPSWFSRVFKEEFGYPPSDLHK